MKQIGVIGAGIAGLQLGLHLRQAGIAVTIYTERSAERLRSSRIANIVLRSAPTRERERRLGVAHWAGAEPELTCQRVSVGGPDPLSFEGAFDRPVSSIDMRIYCARLLEDLAQRGGRVVLGRLLASDLPSLAERHDLLVAASGRGSLSSLFPRIPERSPYSAPQRLVIAGLYRGVDPGARPMLEVSAVRGHGEIIAFPILSFGPALTAIGVEIVTDDARPAGTPSVFAPLRRLRPGHDPARFNQIMLGLLKQFAPSLAARCDPAAFGLTRPLDHCHAAITPAVRAGYARLPNGRFAVAVGDAHVVIDPLIGQGANTASRSAWALGEAIAGADQFDEAFCRRAEEQQLAYAGPIAAAGNAQLRQLTPHVAEVLAAASRHQPVADAWVRGFNEPDVFWHHLERPERAAAFLAALGVDPLLARAL